MTLEWEEIQRGMAPLFEKAEREGLWFHCSYQDLWFSPEELKRHQSNGQFRWGSANWKLRDPKELEHEAVREAASAMDRVADIRRRMKRGHP